MKKDLPDGATLESLDKEAQDVLSAWATGKPDRGFSQPMQSQPKLDDARRVVAESYGFESWDDLETHFGSAG